MSATALEGSLADVGILDLCRLIGGGRRTGVLALGDDGAVAFVDGEVTAVDLPGGASTGDALVGVGAVSAAQLEEAWGRAEAAGGLHAALLEVVPREGLEAAVADRFAAALFELVLPSEHRFTFHDGASHVAGDAVRVPVEDLVPAVEGKRDHWARVAAAIPSVHVVLRRTLALPPEVSSISLSPDEWAVLGAVDGRRSVADVIAATGRSALEVCSALYRLLGAGAVERLEAG